MGGMCVLELLTLSKGPHSRIGAAPGTFSLGQAQSCVSLQATEAPCPRSPLLMAPMGADGPPWPPGLARVNSQAAVRRPSWWHLTEALSTSRAVSSRQT